MSIRMFSGHRVTTYDSFGKVETKNVQSVYTLMGPYKSPEARIAKETMDMMRENPTLTRTEIVPVIIVERV